MKRERERGKKKNEIEKMKREKEKGGIEEREVRRRSDEREIFFFSFLFAVGRDEDSGIEEKNRTYEDPKRINCNTKINQPMGSFLIFARILFSLYCLFDSFLMHI